MYPNVINKLTLLSATKFWSLCSVHVIKFWSLCSVHVIKFWSLHSVHVITYVQCDSSEQHIGLLNVNQLAILNQIQTYKIFYGKLFDCAIGILLRLVPLQA